jgi:hypothetical protein
MFTSGSAGNIVAGVIMIAVGLLFGILAALDLIILLRVGQLIWLISEYVFINSFKSTLW